jgi:hypothetical protein
METEEDEMELKEYKDNLQKLLMVNSIKCIDHMRIQPWKESTFDIPHYYMVYMPLMKPTLDFNIKIYLKLNSLMATN